MKKQNYYDSFASKTVKRISSDIHVAFAFATRILQGLNTLVLVCLINYSTKTR